MAEQIADDERKDVVDTTERLSKLTEKNFKSNTAMSARLDEMDAEVKSLYRALFLTGLSLAGIMIILWAQEKDVRKLKKVIPHNVPTQG